MTDRAKQRDADDAATDAPLSHSATDPFTGTPGVGPITPGSPRGGGWGLAARWFMFAILIIAFCLCLYWFFGAE